MSPVPTDIKGSYVYSENGTGIGHVVPYPVAGGAVVNGGLEVMPDELDVPVCEEVGFSVGTASIHMSPYHARVAHE